MVGGTCSAELWVLLYRKTQEGSIGSPRTRPRGSVSATGDRGHSLLQDSWPGQEMWPEGYPLSMGVPQLKPSDYCPATLPQGAGHRVEAELDRFFWECHAPQWPPAQYLSPSQAPLLRYSHPVPPEKTQAREEGGVHNHSMRRLIRSFIYSTKMACFLPSSAEGPGSLS